MKLALAIETTAPVAAVALGGDAVPVAQRERMRHDPEFRGVAELAASCLDAVGATFANIGAIGVDAGPGGPTYTRAGVAYANGLAFSLGLPVFAPNSLELMAEACREISPRPALCLRKGPGRDAFAGLFADGATTFRYGPFASVVAELAGGLSDVCVAGEGREAVAELLPATRVQDSGIERPGVLTLYRLLAEADEWVRAHTVPAAIPFTQASPLFHEQAVSQQPEDSPRR
jgi:tRNA A37 threonylcarbamoyladenosine modification protein TsaB